jgi:hypothetical protein
MALVAMDRKEFLRALNSHFTEKTIRDTADKLSKLPKDVELSAMIERLGIIGPKDLKTWHVQTGRIPELISRAFVAGVRAHLRALDETKGSRFAGPKALRINVVDADAFGLRVSQQPRFTKITVAMRNTPYTKK